MSKKTKQKSEVVSDEDFRNDFLKSLKQFSEAFPDHPASVRKGDLLYLTIYPNPDEKNLSE